MTEELRIASSSTGTGLYRGRELSRAPGPNECARTQERLHRARWARELVVVGFD